MTEYRRVNEPEVGFRVDKVIVVVVPDGRKCKRNPRKKYETHGLGDPDDYSPCNKPATFCVDYITTRTGATRHWRNKAGWCDEHMSPRIAEMFNINWEYVDGADDLPT